MCTNLGAETIHAVLAIVLTLSFLEGCANPNRTKNTLPSSAAPTADARARALIEQLVSRFPPRFENGAWEDTFGGDPDKPRHADADRVKRAWDQLTAMGIAAFPALVAASDDQRYSFSEVNAAWENYSVGDACFRIIESEVDFYGLGYKWRDAAGGKTLTKPGYLWDVRADGKLKQWWDQRKNRTLVELQIESLRWTIAQEESAGFKDEKQRQQVLEPLINRLHVLGAH